MHLVADSLRALILARADWSDAPDSCDPAVLRTFSADTSAAQRARTEEIIGRLEELVVSYGLDTPLDTDAGHELLAAVTVWESGGGTLLWDSKAGERARSALAPGLGGRFRNAQTQRCERLLSTNEVTVVVPALSRFTPPKPKGVRLRVLSGEPALTAARTAAAGRAFSYVRVGPLVRWQDYALVTTRRVNEAGTASTAAADAGLNDVGNSTYLLHRGTDGWRLLVIARTW
jgi:hypothetical protein